MTGAKMCLVVGIAAQVAQLPGGTGASGNALVDVFKSLGIVGVLLVLLGVIYRDGKKRQEKTEALLEANATAQITHAEAMTKHAEATRAQAEATFQMAAVVRDCGVRRGVTAPPAVPEVGKPI